MASYNKLSRNKIPKPLRLASVPPTDKKINVPRAFEWLPAAWWKTPGSQVKNVMSRYSVVDYFTLKSVMGLNNIELISDRPLDINLIE